MRRIAALIGMAAVIIACEYRPAHRTPAPVPDQFPAWASGARERLERNEARLADLSNSVATCRGMAVALSNEVRRHKEAEAGRSNAWRAFMEAATVSVAVKEGTK